MKENYVKSKVKQYARYKGWKVYDLDCKSQRGFPDTLFVRSGSLFLVEFKRPNKTFRKLQNKIATELVAEGVEVFLVDTIKSGQELLLSKEVNHV